MIDLIQDHNSKRRIKMDIDGGRYNVRTEQNVDRLLDVNRAAANEYRKGGLIGDTQRHMQHVAEIPADLYFQWVRDYGEPSQNPTKWKQLLNDSNNAYLRTGGGRI